MARISITALAGAALLALPLFVIAPATAQGSVYRCGNEYTNQPAGRKNCELLTSGNVTVVRGTAPSGASSSSSSSAARAPGKKAVSGGASAGSNANVSDFLQRRRDSDRRAILERELQRAERKQADLEAEYKDGQPDKIGGEARNYQKYLDRVADLKASIERNQSDIDGIKRELERVGGAAPSAAN